MITAAQIRSWAKEREEDIRADVANCKDYPQWLKNEPLGFDLYATGAFLQDLFRNGGMDDEEIHDACFAHGQRCLGRDPYESAAKYANEFEATGRISDRPGLDLAMQIHNELAEILSPEIEGPPTYEEVQELKKSTQPTQPK